MIDGPDRLAAEQIEQAGPGLPGFAEGVEHRLGNNAAERIARCARRRLITFSPIAEATEQAAESLRDGSPAVDGDGAHQGAVQVDESVAIPALLDHHPDRRRHG